MQKRRWRLAAWRLESGLRQKESDWEAPVTCEREESKTSLFGRRQTYGEIVLVVSHSDLSIPRYSNCSD